MPGAGSEEYAKERGEELANDMRSEGERGEEKEKGKKEEEESANRARPSKREWGRRRRVMTAKGEEKNRMRPKLVAASVCVVLVYGVFLWQLLRM